MRFLVTGGAGFIGSSLVERLIELGEDVVVVDDFSTGSQENLTDLEGRFELVEGDIVDDRVCRRAMRGVDFVCHQAALGSVPRSIENPLRTHEVNVKGTLNLLIAARDAGVKRFVYASSSSAYGDTPVLPKREDMLPAPRSPYAVSKLAGEQYCRAFWYSYGLPTVSLRYFNVFGRRQDAGSQYAAVIPLFIAAASRSEPPTIYGDGEQSRDFTYIGNVVQANQLALAAPEAALGAVFNIGCAERVTINELWAGIKTLTGARIEAEYSASRTGDVRHSLADIALAGKLLGYEPEVRLAEGLERTIEHFRSAGSLSALPA